MKTKKDNAVPDAPTVNNAPPPHADLKKEFSPAITKLLVGALALRAARLTATNKGVVVVHPVDQEQVDASQVHAEQIARIERMACLAIMRRFVDADVCARIDSAVNQERGSTVSAWTCEWTLAALKRWPPPLMTETAPERRRETMRASVPVITIRFKPIRKWADVELWPLSEADTQALVVMVLCAVCFLMGFFCREIH